MPYEEPGLFDATPFRVDGPAPTTPAEHISAGRKLTARQSGDVTRGRHPLTGGPLHAQAAPARGEPGRTCGTCAFRTLLTHHSKSYPKCDFGGGARATNGPASDVRKWWPGCADHQTEAEAHQPTDTNGAGGARKVCVRCGDVWPCAQAAGRGAR